MTKENINMRYTRYYNT